MVTQTPTPSVDLSQRVRVLLSAPGNEALSALYGAAILDSRVSVQALAPTLDLLVQQLPLAGVEVAVVDAELLVPMGEGDMVRFLAERHGGAAMIVLIPPTLEPLRGRLQQLDRVRDVLAKPVVPGALLERVWQVAQSERAVRAQVSPVSALGFGWGAAAAAGGAPTQPRAVGSHVVAVTAYKGGTGKSTVATNLAYRLAAQGVRTLLVGLDTPDATGIQLGLRPTPNMGAWFRASSREVLQGALQRKDGVLDVLLSPNDIVHARQIEQAEFIARLARTAEALASAAAGRSVSDVVQEAALQVMRQPPADGRIAALIDEARLLYPPYAALVLDLPPTQSEWAIQPLSRATVVLVVAEPNRADQANVVHLLNIVTGVLDERYRVPREAIYLVLNRVTDRDPLTPQAFREGIESVLGWAPPVIARIPHHPAVREAQLRFALPVQSVDEFRGGIDQIVAFLFPEVASGGAAQAKPGVKLGGVRIRIT